jgi:hypothetical protein
MSLDIPIPKPQLFDLSFPGYSNLPSEGRISLTELWKGWDFTWWELQRVLIGEKLWVMGGIGNGWVAYERLLIK